MTQKLSKHYRNDSDTGLDPEIRAYLDKEYFSKLPNINRRNPKLLVLFSGGNAAGKSTLSRKISHELHSIVLENDAVKRCLLARWQDLDRVQLNQLTWKYTMQLYRNLDSYTSNGFIVRDGLIDWYYDRILPIFTGAEYELFVIAFDISREKSIELIRARGDTPTTSPDRLITILDDHEIHTKRFRSLYTPDILLTEQNLYDHKSVIDAIQQKLDSLR